MSKSPPSYILQKNRQKIIIIICCRHSYKCIYNEHNYTCITQLLFIQTIYKLKVCSCITAYVYSQWWYCAHMSNAFLNMGEVRSRKYCASISDMTTTWGLRREVVLRINLPRASIEAWQMLWHISSNGSRGWLRNWGKGYITSREIKYGNSNSGTC